MTMPDYNQNIPSYGKHTRAAIDMLAGREPPRIPVKSDSMRPVLEPGDLVAVTPCGPRDLEIGDVVVIENNSSLIVHRFLYVRRGKIVTKGDRRRRADAPVSAEHLVGRVTRIERGTITRQTGGTGARVRGIASIVENMLCQVKDFLIEQVIHSCFWTPGRLG
jgi:signal peptidase I